MNLPEAYLEFADAARRLSDAVTTHILAHIPAAGGFPDWNGPQPWIAFDVQSGESDMNLYPSKGDAIRHQLHRDSKSYITIPDDGMTMVQAAVVVKYHRQMKAAGIDLADPDSQVHMPMRAEDTPHVINQLRSHPHGR